MQHKSQRSWFVVVLAALIGLGSIGAATTAEAQRVEFRLPHVQVTLGRAPPPPRYYYVDRTPPASDLVWQNGYWAWNGQQHVWVDGRWVHSRPGYAWRDARWERRGSRQWHYQPGAWYRAQPTYQYQQQPVYVPQPAPAYPRERRYEINFGGRGHRDHDRGYDRDDHRDRGHDRGDRYDDHDRGRGHGHRH